jgi:hypothetical protein
MTSSSLEEKDASQPISAPNSALSFPLETDEPDSSSSTVTTTHKSTSANTSQQQSHDSAHSEGDRGDPPYRSSSSSQRSLQQQQQSLDSSSGEREDGDDDNSKLSKAPIVIQSNLRWQRMTMVPIMKYLGNRRQHNRLVNSHIQSPIIVRNENQAARKQSILRLRSMNLEIVGG